MTPDHPARGWRWRLGLAWDQVVMVFRRNVWEILRFPWTALFSLVLILLTAAQFHFISRLGLGGGALDGYDGISYFTYVFIGLFVSFVVMTAMGEFLELVNDAYEHNWLEHLLLSPGGLRRYFTGELLFTYAWELVNLVLFLAVGILLFGAELEWGWHWLPVGVLLALLVLALTGLGLTLASLFFLGRVRGDTEAVSDLFILVSGLLTGVYFPVTLLPGLLERVAWLFPQTHALAAIRDLLLANAAWDDTGVLRAAGYLLVFTAVTLPLGLWSFRRGLARASREGELAVWE